MYPKILKLNNKKINNSIKKQVKNLSRYINGEKWDITKYLLKWLKSKNSGNTKCWWGWGTTDIFIHCWLECKTVQPLWKLFGQLLTELNIVSTYDPAIILRDIFPVDLKTYVNTKICMWMFVAALFKATGKISPTG